MVSNHFHFAHALFENTILRILYGTSLATTIAAALQVEIDQWPGTRKGSVPHASTNRSVNTGIGKVDGWALGDVE
uniref:Uncharacterized protein n=1 Tax=mine drainage metagenome TaxID=410659 RepID=E6Q3Q7_9ZZZZ